MAKKGITPRGMNKQLLTTMEMHLKTLLKGQYGILTTEDLKLAAKLQKFIEENRI